MTKSLVVCQIKAVQLQKYLYQLKSSLPGVCGVEKIVMYCYIIFRQQKPQYSLCQEAVQSISLVRSLALMVDSRHLLL